MRAAVAARLSLFYPFISSFTIVLLMTNKFVISGVSILEHIKTSKEVVYLF